MHGTVPVLVATTGQPMCGQPVQDSHCTGNHDRNSPCVQAAFTEQSLYWQPVQNIALSKQPLQDSPLTKQPIQDKTANTGQTLDQAAETGPSLDETATTGQPLGDAACTEKSFDHSRQYWTVAAPGSQYWIVP
jgi:hypothetical protein